MENTTGLIGFKKDGQEYTIAEKNFEKVLNEITNFYKNNALGSIEEVLNKIVWITENELKESKIKNKHYLKDNNKRQYFILLLTMHVVQDIKVEMLQRYDKLKEDTFKQNEHISFNDKEVQDQINCNFTKIDNKLYLQFLNINATDYSFKIIINMDNDTLEITKDNDTIIYNRTNI